jgi:hypothetical protein
MIENFLRSPRTLGATVADAIRVLGLVSVVVAGIWFQATDAGILALALPALLVPRFLGVRSGFDILYGITVLVAAWSNVLDLYTALRWWDVPVHLLCTGLLAAVLYVALERFAVIPHASRPARQRVVLMAVLGLAISALWEMVEWFGYTFISDEIFVAYQDTIGDMAVGGLGALLAGVALTRVRLLDAPA